MFTLTKTTPVLPLQSFVDNEVIKCNVCFQILDTSPRYEYFCKRLLCGMCECPCSNKQYLEIPTAIQNQLRRFPVSCCNWTGLRSDFENHLGSTEHKETVLAAAKSSNNNNNKGNNSENLAFDMNLVKYNNVPSSSSSSSFIALASRNLSPSSSSFTLQPSIKQIVEQSELRIRQMLREMQNEWNTRFLALQQNMNTSSITDLVVPHQEENKAVVVIHNSEHDNNNHHKKRSLSNGFEKSTQRIRSKRLKVKRENKHIIIEPSCQKINDIINIDQAQHQNIQSALYLSQQSSNVEGLKIPSVEEVVAWINVSKDRLLELARYYPICDYAAESKGWELRLAKNERVAIPNTILGMALERTDLALSLNGMNTHGYFVIPRTPLLSETSVLQWFTYYQPKYVKNLHVRVVAQTIQRDEQSYFPLCPTGSENSPILSSVAAKFYFRIDEEGFFRTTKDKIKPAPMILFNNKPSQTSSVMTPTTTSTSNNSTPRLLCENNEAKQEIGLSSSSSMNIDSVIQQESNNSNYTLLQQFHAMSTISTHDGNAIISDDNFVVQNVRKRIKEVAFALNVPLISLRTYFPSFTAREFAQFIGIQGFSGLTKTLFEKVLIRFDSLEAHCTFNAAIQHSKNNVQLNSNKARRSKNSKLISKSSILIS
jgi:hypothetical protein